MKNSLAILVFAACATASAFAGTPDNKHDTPTPPGNQAPALEIVFDCGDCKPDASVQALIEGSYLDAAKKVGVTIGESEKATLKITNYNERSAMARALIGLFAGLDRIAGTLTWRGGSADVNDTARSAASGIDIVARNIGEEALAKITQAKPAETEKASGQ